MKRTFLGLITLISLPMMAGGYLTNTNQSISFLRNPSQDAAINIGALYNNPAGTAFLKPGFHFAIGIQNVHQNRDVTSIFNGYQYGKKNEGYDVVNGKKFEGRAVAPILPSLQAVYNWADKWSVSFDFGLVGGGGKCTYDNGLPSFESKVAMIPAIARQYGLPVTGYDFDTYMRGRSYQYGFQGGLSYKLAKNLSLYAGARLIYATNNYFGFVKNIKLGYAGGYYSASDIVSQYATQASSQVASAVKAGIMTPEEATVKLATLQVTGAALVDGTQDIELNCNQTGFAITPIVGVDWQVNKCLNLAAKFEVKTRLRLDNESVNVNTENVPALAAYEHGETVPEDIPSILTVGAMYTPVKFIRLNAGYHYYWDKQATKVNNVNKKLSGGTWEITAGAEFDFCDRWTVSAGWQTTNYPNTDEYMKDISFTTNSNTFGFGAKCQITDCVAVEAAYFQTVYNTYERNSDSYASFGEVALPGTDKFNRTNRVIGVGVTLDF